MLGKLLKYEFKSTWQLNIYGYVIVLALALICRGLSLSSGTSGLFEGLLVMSIIMVITFAFASSFIRFNKNFLTDEAYLTFTLPVKVNMQLISKVLVTMLWIMCAISASFLAIMIRWGNGAFFDKLRFVLNMLVELLVDYVDMSEVDGALLIFELIILGISVLLQFVLTIFFCMTVASGSQKFKSLIVVAVYLGVYLVINLLSEAYTSVVWEILQRITTPMLIVHTGIWMSVLFNSIIIIACWVFIERRLSKHLNVF